LSCRALQHTSLDRADYTASQINTFGDAYPPVDRKHHQTRSCMNTIYSGNTM
jgi:hypothetical protein